MNKTMHKLLTIAMVLAILATTVAGAFAAEIPSGAFKLPAVKERIEEDKTPAEEPEQEGEDTAAEEPVGEQEIVEDEPKGEQPEQDAEEPAAQPDAIGKATVNLQDANGNLNVRAEGNADGELLDKIANGESVTILASENGWTKIRTASGMEGWVASSYLNIEETPVEEDPVVEPTEEPVEEEPIEGEPTEEPVEEESIEGELIEEPVEEESIGGELTEEPVVEEPVVEYLTDENGELVLDENGNPIPVVTEEEVVEEAAEERILRQVMVLQPEGKTLPLYAEPSTSSAVLAEIPGGETIQVSEINSDWSYAIYGGTEGYVLTDKIALMDDGMITPEDEAVIRTIRITSSLNGATTVIHGETVTLYAKLTGFENDNYSIQWVCSKNGGASTQKISGATGSSYSISVTEDNAHWLFGVVVTVYDEEPAA